MSLKLNLDTFLESGTWATFVAVIGAAWLFSSEFADMRSDIDASRDLFIAYKVERKDARARIEDLIAHQQTQIDSLIALHTKE